MICSLWSINGGCRRKVMRETALTLLRRGWEALDSGTDDDGPGGHRDPEARGLKRIPVRIREDDNAQPPRE